MEEAEVITLLLGGAALLVTYFRRAELRELEGARLLVVSFGLLFSGWVLTVLEGWFWKSALDLLEHACYAASAVLVAAWCRRRLSQREGSVP